MPCIGATGSQAEIDKIVDDAIAEGTFRRMNEKTHPNCLYHRSNPTDVARVEHLTFICSEKEEGRRDRRTIGCRRRDARAKVWPLYEGAMKGRTMYVLPYVMGPARIEHQQGGCRDHGQPLRRGEHADHDPNGFGGSRTARKLDGLLQGIALTGRPRSGAPFHSPLPEGPHDLEHRQRLRWKRLAGEEVLRLAHREHDGA